MRIPLIGGAYSARSRIAACVRSINYFPEKNSEGSAVAPYTLYQAPGFKPLTSDPANVAPMRQVYRASNGDGYCVIGQGVYYIQPNWVLSKLGTLSVVATTPVYLSDNGVTILLVDGSPIGYTINMTSRALAPLVDPDGFFLGGGSVDTIDGFVLWSVPGTRQFKSTLNNQITPFDDTYTASKSGYPDLLQRLIINRLQILLLGTLKSEIWYDVGGAQFPFARIPGTYIEHGTCAPYSAAASDISVFWLSQDLQGVGYVMRQRVYDTKVISNYAISVAIRKMQDTVGISDAIGYTYTQDGHAFYVLVFPAGNQTWVFDDSIEDLNLAWHQRCWTDGQGNLNRDRSNCGAFLYGKNVVGDWSNGTLYALDLNTYTDTVAGVTYAKSFIRTFPHLPFGQVGSQSAQMQGQDSAIGQQAKFEQFVVDMQCGEGSGGPADPVTGEPTADKVWLRWSTDRGQSFGQAVMQSTGVPGEYSAQPKYGILGAGRDVVFEISHSINGPAAINGAWVKTTVLGN